MKESVESENCEYFNTADCWKNCAWGRYNDGGKELVLDEIAEEIINKIKSGKVNSNGMEKKIEVMGNADDKILIPCTGMTGVQEDFKNKDKYYGSVCGASFPTTILGSIFATARQINPNITKEHFFEVMKESALINSSGQKYLNLEGMLEIVKDENKKDGFADCIKDGKTSIREINEATKTTESNVREYKNVEYTNEERN